jgi:hypothetical protein
MSPFWKMSAPVGAQNLAEELGQLGLFDRMDAVAADRAKQAFARRGIDALWSIELGREVFAGDAEDLAEGGIGEFLEVLRPYLSERGVAFGDVEDLFSDDGTRYDVRVGNEVHAIYRTDAGDSMERMWGLAWVRAFEIVNRLLEKAGSPERAYTMPEWNVWFLTPQQCDAIRAAIAEPRERPYAPVDDPPWYGAEH